MLEALVVSQVVLWVVVAALALVTLALARQIGVLHERIAPVGALMTGRGPEVGRPAPLFDVTDLQGRPLQVGGRQADGRSRLLLFVAPTCPVCKKLLPAVKSLARRERDRVEVLLASDGPRADHERFVRQQGLEAFRYVVAPEIGMTYQVGKLPYAVLLDAEGTVRARGLVNTREHLESLLVAQETGYASIQEYLRATGHGAGDGRATGHGTTRGPLGAPVHPVEPATSPGDAAPGDAGRLDRLPSRAGTRAGAGYPGSRS